MGTITFDTLKFANTLKEAGVPDKQAAAMVDALREALAEAFASNASQLATTTGDPSAASARLETRTDSLKSMLEAMELRLTIRWGVFLAVAVGIMLTVLKMH